MLEKVTEWRFEAETGRTVDRSEPPGRLELTELLGRELANVLAVGAVEAAEMEAAEPMALFLCVVFTWVVKGKVNGRIRVSPDKFGRLTRI